MQGFVGQERRTLDRSASDANCKRITTTGSDQYQDHSGTKKQEEMKKVTIMCRVSSDEQAKGYSLDDQFDRLSDYCKRWGYEVVHVIREDHSAKSFDRPEWKAWMKKVKSKELDTDELLVTSWDRFSRDLTDGLNVVRDLMKRGITPQAIEQPVDLNIPDQWLMLAVYMAAPDVDNQKRSIKIRRGVRQGLKNGYWPRKPFFGYISARNEEGKHIIIPDLVKAPIVREIFEEVAKGTPQNEIRADLAERGIKVSRNNMSKMLKRLIYMGKIVVPALEKEPMQIVEGRHEPIISETLFYEVQQTLQGNRKARGKAIPKYAKLRDDFHLRGVLNCNECGNTMTASFSKGKLGKRYGYYHCNHCKKQRVSAIKVHAAFDELLKSIQIEPEIMTLYNAFLEDEMKTSEVDNKAELNKLKIQLDQIENRLIKSQDLMLDGKLDPDEYVSIKARYKKQKKDIKDKIANFKASKRELTELIQNGLHLLENIRETYVTGSIHLKHKIVGSIFMEQLSFDGKKCRTPKLNKIFDLFPNIDKGLGKVKRGQLNEIFQLSPSAERGRFELPIPFRVYTRSRRAHSTTLPPLQLSYSARFIKFTRFPVSHYS